MNTTIAILGAGNLGTSVLKGLIQHGYPCDQLWLTNRTTQKLATIEQQWPIHTTTDNKIASSAAKIIILAAKPHNIADLATEIAPTVQTHRPLIISVAAGIHTESLANWLGAEIPIIRAMPNTPTMIGAGATGLYANSSASAEQCQQAEAIFKHLGATIWLKKERDLDTVTALSASGVAFFFLLMEAFEQAGEQLGLASETAHLLTIQTALGAARMAAETGQSLAQLRQQVTSKGGTTEQGLQILEKHHIQQILLETLTAAKLRAEELSLSQKG